MAKRYVVGVGVGDDTVANWMGGRAMTSSYKLSLVTICSGLAAIFNAKLLPASALSSMSAPIVDGMMCECHSAETTAFGNRQLGFLFLSSDYGQTSRS